MPARRAGDVDAIRIGSGANVFECELEGHRHELAGKLKLIDARDGAGRCRRANRLLGRDGADANAVRVGDRHGIHETQPERALCDEPRFVAFDAVLRQLRRPAGPGERMAIGGIGRHRELDVGRPRHGDALRGVEQLAGGRLVAAGRRHERVGVRHAARDGLQPRGHHRKCAADVAIHPRPHRRRVRAEHDAFRDAPRGDHRQHANRAGQRDREHTAKRRVHY